ncbi:MAG TPA: carbonic anhydrase [Oligoflexia bacterium]|nr:carbonic anhydrase [Oligoflexia bacterium]
MKKLVRGIVEFRKNIQPEYRTKFAALALGQSPDTLFIACSDSRVVPNLFASTDPGDLFVVRNVGNLIPCCDESGVSKADESEAAAIEFAVLNLGVSDIVVCGHSECGAMRALVDGREKVPFPNLREWLRHGEPSKKRLKQKNLSVNHVNPLSQANVLEQIEHLKTYPLVRERVAARRLRLHAWWFELSTANVYAYEDDQKQFVLIDEAEAARILGALGSSGSDEAPK